MSNGDFIAGVTPDLRSAQEALLNIIDVLKNFDGAVFPGELTRQGKDVPINGFSALCTQTLDYMELKYGKGWEQRNFAEVPFQEQWDRIENSAAHNFMWALSQAVEAGQAALAADILTQPPTDTEALDDADAIRAAVVAMTPMVTNETHAWNLWNWLATSPEFERAYLRFHPRSVPVSTPTDEDERQALTEFILGMDFGGTWFDGGSQGHPDFPDRPAMHRFTRQSAEDWANALIDAGFRRQVCSVTETDVEAAYAAIGYSEHGTLGRNDMRAALEAVEANRLTRPKTPPLTLQSNTDQRRKSYAQDNRNWSRPRTRSHIWRRGTRRFCNGV